MADTELIAAVRKLVKAKGRYHTEQNYLAVVAALDMHDFEARRATSSVSEGEMPELPKGYRADEFMYNTIVYGYDELCQAQRDGYQAGYRAATKAAAPADARIEALARKLVEFYPTKLPEMYCDGEPVGRQLVETCRASLVPAIPGTGREKEWKWVPIEPTDEMLRVQLAVEWPATYKEYLRHPLNGERSKADNEREIAKAKKRWASMLAVAPSHPSEAKAGEDA